MQVRLQLPSCKAQVLTRPHILCPWSPHWLGPSPRCTASILTLLQTPEVSGLRVLTLRALGLETSTLFNPPVASQLTSSLSRALLKCHLLSVSPSGFVLEPTHRGSAKLSYLVFLCHVYYILTQHGNISSPYCSLCIPHPLSTDALNVPRRLHLTINYCLLSRWKNGLAYLILGWW